MSRVVELRPGSTIPVFASDVNWDSRDDRKTEIDHVLNSLLKLQSPERPDHG